MEYSDEEPKRYYDDEWSDDEERPYLSGGLAESGEEPWRRHDVDDPLKPAPVDGNLYEKSLELLARGHNLNTFGVSFRQRYYNLFDLD